MSDRPEPGQAATPIFPTQDNTIAMSRQGEPSRWILPLVCSAQLLLQLDFSIVNVALPSMQTGLGFTPSLLQWVVTGYALTFGALLLFGGRVGDILGHRLIVILGLAVFALASLSGGFAGDPVVLITSRLVQGASAAFVAPSVLAILTRTFTADAARARALGIFQAATAGGATAGIVLGGVLVQFFGWRAVMLVNPPIIIVLVLLMIWHLPKSPDRGPRMSLDVPGAALITATAAAIVLAASEGQQRGFGSPVPIVAMTFALGLGIAFVLVERKTRHPVLPLVLMRDRGRVGALLVIFLAGLVIVSYVYFTSLFMQNVMHFSALQTGLGLVPATVIVMFSSAVLSRLLLPHLGVRGMLTLGLPIIAAGQVWLSFVEPDGRYVVHILPGLILTALGMGLTIPSAAFAANSNVPAGTGGVAGGLFVTAQQLGAAIGLAILASVAAARVSATGIPTDGYHTAFITAACIAIGAAVVAFVVVPARQRPTSALAIGQGD